MNNLEFVYEATLEGWLRALDMKDKQTGGHSHRLADLSVAIGLELGIEKDDLVHLRRGALLHDIGKIGIPDSILNKTGPLSEEERELMDQHPKFGYDLLAPIPFLGPEADIAYCHHENWDGSGYPRGLKGEDIPLMARIVSVCNVWDALMSDQPYRKAWKKKDARNYIYLGSDHQFDPEVVAAFLHFIRDKN
jgi:HD-GYP domain-containing protein (c-di-GMP phosphodiesterase class II)